MNEQEKVERFTLSSNGPAVVITHGYDVANDCPVHFHTTLNVGIIEKGERTLKIDNEQYILETGDIFIIQPNEPHSIKSNSSIGHNYKIISFSAQQFSGRYFSDSVIRDSFFFNLLSHFHSLVTDASEMGNVRNILDRIKLYLVSLSVIAKINTKPDLVRIVKAKEHIVEHCTEPISLAAIARIGCLSPFHFNRLFKKHVGMTPCAYVIYCRIRRSQSTMHSETIAQMGGDLGFFDQSHFTKAFKKYTGVTPKKFRNYDANILTFLNP
jgi:AraC-like DNA-binding protein/mannose-6-phosphate isomerase-like protein (cupin superfamily)